MPYSKQSLQGIDIDNQWDFWLFPKRTTKDGKGMAASANLYETLSARYPGIARMGTPEGNASGSPRHNVLRRRRHCGPQVGSSRRDARTSRR